jgi:hypothetical protein
MLVHFNYIGSGSAHAHVPSDSSAHMAQVEAVPDKRAVKKEYKPVMLNGKRGIRGSRKKPDSGEPEPVVEVISLPSTLPSA